jgi:hypothetical protein
MSQELNDKCIETINSLFVKYNENDYMKNRIFNHIVNCLPNTLINELENHEIRKNRTLYLTNEQQIFIQVFLQKNQYYYLNNNFYEYNGKNYLIIKEDDIIHKLLSSISKERILLDWKQKTKITILKQIKERNLFSSIPESDTIQNILALLYPSMFESRNYAKYFLSIIGDNILKKHNQNIFLISSDFKKIINEIENTAIGSIGINNIGSNFITKCHENHTYNNYRLIKFTKNVNFEIWRDILKKSGLNLLCVAAHYRIKFTMCCCSLFK